MMSLTLLKNNIKKDEANFGIKVTGIKKPPKIGGINTYRYKNAAIKNKAAL